MHAELRMPVLCLAGIVAHGPGQRDEREHLRAANLDAKEAHLEGWDLKLDRGLGGRDRVAGGGIHGCTP